MDNFTLYGSNPGYANSQAYPSAPMFRGYTPQVQVTTNIELVTSLEEALFKSNVRNSDMLYLDQNKPLIYRVKVSAEGVKSYLTLPYSLPNQPDSTPATKADLQTLEERIAALEAGKMIVKKKKPEVIENGESNG